MTTIRRFILTIIFREASPYDAEQIVGLIRDVHAEPIPTMPRMLDEVPYAPYAEREHIEYCVKTANCAYFVAEYQGRVIGLVTMDGGSIRATQHSALLGILVDKDHRGQGVGKGLMEQAIGWARNVTIKRVELNVFATNDTAVALYQKFGFEIEGRRRNALCIRGQWIDDYIMALMLS
jgi:RimJ/RimL family protein N-acetyltransferase